MPEDLIIILTLRIVSGILVLTNAVRQLNEKNFFRPVQHFGCRGRFIIQRGR